MSSATFITEEDNEEENSENEDPLEGYHAHDTKQQLKEAPQSYAKRMRSLYVNSDRWVNQVNNL